MNSNQELKTIKIGNNKTEYYKNNKKYKAIYKNEKIEVVTHYSGNKQNERIQKVETIVHKKDGLLKRTTNYFMNKRVSSIIEFGSHNTFIRYDKIEGKKVISLEKFILNKNEKTPKSKELHAYTYKKSRLVKEIVQYYGNFIKSGIGLRIIKYDLNGNLISDKNNIEYYNEKLSKRLKYKIFKIYNEELKNRFPNLPENTNDYTYGLNDVKKMLTESLNVSLDDGSLMREHYEPNDIYELPFKFASAVYNTLAQKNNAYIKMETPEIFKDVDEKELFEKLNILSFYQRDRSEFLPLNSIIKLKLGDKIFDCTAIGKGLEGNIFRISYENKKPVILKIYHAGEKYCFIVSFAPFGLYGSIAILREANLAKVEDIVKLYYANPIYTPVGFNGKEIKFVGAWQICEDAETRTYVGNGLKFKDWVESHGLVWNDNRKVNWINGICIDPGCVETLKPRTFLNYGIGENEINLIYSRYINRETTKQILDFLDKKQYCK